MSRSNTANAFETTLTNSASGTDLTFNVQSTSGAPAAPCYLVIEPDNPSRREYVYFDGTFTGTSFATSTLAHRYLDGSAAGSGITHPAGSVVRTAAMSQHFTDLWDTVENLDTVLDTHLSADDPHSAYLNLSRHDVPERHGIGTVIPAAAPSTLTPSTSNGEGSADAVARADHTHDVAGFLPSAGGTATGHLSGITPTNAAHLTRKDYVDALVAAVIESLSSHESTTNPHSATNLPTASRLILRDSAGRARVNAPSNAADIARKAEVDAVTPSLAKRRRTSSTGFTSGSWSNMTFNSTVNSDSSRFTFTGNICTVLQAGLYLVEACLICTFSGGATNTRTAVGFNVNDNDDWTAYGRLDHIGSVAGTVLTVTTAIRLAANDVLRGRVFNGGTSPTMDAGTSLAVTYLAP